MEKKAVILNIYGKVQGVGFRYYTQKKANELGLKGYVKNKADGSVYVEAEGGEVQLQEFINWCEEGPTWARVSKVEQQFVPLLGHADFQVK
ncbi:MAG TPA: acylphosphatase [Bacteroidales bacterium]